MDVKKRSLFNENGDVEVSKKRMINGNTTNLNDFNNMKYGWVSEWYRQAMNNFWIPEEINLAQDLKDYNKLEEAEKTAYDKILSFLIILQLVKLIYVLQYRLSKKLYTLKAIAICWILYVLQKREMKYYINGKMMKYY